MSRRALSIRPVQSIKHIIETTGLVSLAAASITDLINTVNFPDVGVNPNANNPGSSVHSIYLRVEVIGVIAAGGNDNIYMAVVKNPGANFSFPVIDQFGVSDIRRFVIHQEMVMLTPFEATGTTGFPRTMFKGVIRIPRGYKRNGLEDKLQLIIQHSTGEASQTTRFCVECIYKEFQ